MTTYRIPVRDDVHLRDPILDFLLVLLPQN